jgi:riboflavin biosynthesis pyrimidine reductase
VAPVASAEPLSDGRILDLYRMPEDRAWLRVNFVASADGSATLDGRSGGLGGDADRRVLGLLRVACDALMVGRGTLHAERYGPLALSQRLRALRLEQGRAENPVLVVVSQRLDLGPNDPIFHDAPVRPVVFTCQDSADARGGALATLAEVVPCGQSDVDLSAAVKYLTGNGCPNLLCEGGPRLLGSLLAEDLVDELCLTVSPTLVGPGAGRIVAGPSSPVRAMALGHVLASGDELLLRYTRRR